mmetsp:Transcript_101122/g.286629  ORF Transcript_101122/g.286629 Transcript_101122/m.286629 type:complete len:428 (+) Transcript_101122:63-1346(+)|eukprot:CAMPEP_0179297896 /NCGR_PEP_ID=MMETSP0797-20121207/45706_1 /TAXON_ID=47934 /ORGANISM="Dinophysis acuminata, Strain DAEP01" /LENGTH=427 /DNA_ID=CAMNT_0021007251 /DNA_START=31 /DNA_END=1314 /DNA_ORIENTATION=+
MASEEATVLLGYIGRQVQNDEELLDVRLSRVGGAPVWSQQPSSPAAVRQQDYFACELCRGPLVMVGQFMAGYGALPQRLLHIFSCSGACGSDPRAWRALRSTGPVSSDAAMPPSQAPLPENVAYPEGGRDGQPEQPRAVADDWGVPAGGDDWGGVGVAGDDWGASPSSGSTPPLDAEIESLLQARDSGAVSSSASAAAATKAVPKRRGQDSAAAGGGDSWVGVVGAPMGEAWPCLAMEIQCEPPAGPKSGDHEEELLQRYLQSELAAEDHGSSDAAALPAEFAREVGDEEAMLVAAADAEADDFGSSDDEDEHARGDAAKWFLKFQRRLERSPAQVVRYAWGGTPLWMAPPPSEIATGAWPPCCSRCGAARMFELQLLPTFASLVQSACPSISASQMGWGTVVVYTCSKDCAADDPCEEFVVVQPAV